MRADFNNSKHRKALLKKINSPMTAVSKDDQAEREAQHEKVNQPSPQLKKGSPAL